jgi:hypothetical protein
LASAETGWFRANRRGRIDLRTAESVWRTTALDAPCPVDGSRAGREGAGKCLFFVGRSMYGASESGLAWTEGNASAL